jgi:hypothetical protein
MVASPLVRIPNVDPLVGKKLSASDVPCGVPEGGTALKEAALSTAGLASIALASVVAPVASFVTVTMFAAKTALGTSMALARRRTATAAPNHRWCIFDPKPGLMFTPKSASQDASK